MKKTLTVIAVVLVCLALVAALLPVCLNAMLISPEYRACKGFARSHRAGMEKNNVFLQLGYPDGWTDEEGNGRHLGNFVDKDAAREHLLEEYSSVWNYVVYETKFNNKPYRLTITFDDQGKTVTATIEFIPGG